MTNNVPVKLCARGNWEGGIPATLAVLSRQAACCLIRLPPCREGVELVAELPVKRCNIARFSKGGQRFAAAGASNVITVHDTLTLQVVASLRVSASASW